MVNFNKGQKSKKRTDKIVQTLSNPRRKAVPAWQAPVADQFGLARLSAQRLLLLLIQS